MMRVALTRSLCDRGPVAAESLYLLQVSMVAHTCVSVRVCVCACPLGPRPYVALVTRVVQLDWMT